MISQRDAYFNKLFELACKDRDIILITADCGAASLNQWPKELPDQYINVGIAEQNMIMLASGLALSGKKPYCYAMAPFATLRCYEFIKVDICAMNLPVAIVGVGAGLSYNEAGPTHHATEDISIMRALPNMRIASVWQPTTAEYLASQPVLSPIYIRLDRSDGKFAPTIYYIRKGQIVDWEVPLWLKPFTLFPIAPDIDLVVTLEEHLLAGGLGSIVAEYFVDHNIQIPLKRVGIKDEYFYKYGSRTDIWDGENELKRELLHYR